MVKKKSNQKKETSLKGEIIGIIYITLGVLAVFSILKPNSLGIIGTGLNTTLFTAIGLGTYFFPILMIIIGLAYIINRGKLKFGIRFFGIILLVVDILLFIQVYNMSTYYLSGYYMYGIKLICNSPTAIHGGILSYVISIPLYKLLGDTGCYIIFSALFIISFILILNFSISEKLSNIKENKSSKNKIKDIKSKDKIKNLKETEKIDENKEKYIDNLNKKIKILDFMKRSTLIEDNSEEKGEKINIVKSSPKIIEPQNTTINKEENQKIEKELESVIETAQITSNNSYTLPSTELLNTNTFIKFNKDDKKDLLSNAAKLVETLKSFGVDAKVVQVTKGPSVTRFELQPNAGVKVSRIVNLADDIALSLAASAVRIEAPIPGKAAIGIEVPNKELTPVFLREVIESEEFTTSKKNLSFCLGKDISGNSVVADLSKMPHVLIAGATGSGKSVCINTLIISILYKYSPDEVKLLMVDPKVVELSTYNGIPHLLIPVVTDPKKAAGALSWAVTEMNKRYSLFAENNVRNITSYNELFYKGKIQEKIPFLVIIIDELADLMMACANDVEEYIGRLAQMARAAGMHLVIATQRPSVDVITGVIKANIPTRISFAVSSQIDSRTILDMSGAEKLLGKGDMLFMPMEENKPIRIQGAFISEYEVEKVVNSIKNQQQKVEYKEDLIEEITTEASFDDLEQDDLTEDAIKVVLEAGQASTSLLQRRLRIGYNRAARLIDQLEEQGVISSKDGSRPRQVLITNSEYIKE